MRNAKRPRTDHSTSLPEEPEAVDASPDQASTIDYSKICAIEDHGEIFFQFVTANLGGMRKTIKNLASHVKKFLVVCSTSGFMEFFNVDPFTQDMVDWKVEKYDHCYPLHDPEEAKSYQFAIRASDLVEAIDTIPLKYTALIFFLSEDCLDAHQQVYKFNIRGMDNMTECIYDKSIKTQTSLHDSMTSNLVEDSTSAEDQEESVDENEKVKLATRVQCDDYPAIIRWSMTSLKRALDNAGGKTKTASKLSITVNNGEECVMESKTENMDMQTRTFFRDPENDYFMKFDPPSLACPILTNTFKMDSVTNFMKNDNLASHVTMYFDQTFPLILKIDVPELGPLRMSTPSDTV
jgi:hypothetical protein